MLRNVIQLRKPVRAGRIISAVVLVLVALKVLTFSYGAPYLGLNGPLNLVTFIVAEVLAVGAFLIVFKVDVDSDGDDEEEDM